MYASASAPGKIVICGEYAVLDGAPAIVMAVDRRARVTVTASDGDWHSVRAPGYTNKDGRFTVDQGGLVWLEGGESFGLVEQVWQLAGLSPPLKLSLNLDSRAFFDSASGRKIGVGSSAAIAVALTAALDEATGAGLDVARVAMAAHRRFQGGAGSGVDVACSVDGGIIEYRMERATARRLLWPRGLGCAVFWSGVAANTGSRLAQLADTAQKPSRQELSAAAGRVATAWADGSAQQIIDELRAYTDSLRQFSVDHDLGIFDAGHAELARAAQGGVVYKPCGAGGGDIGIALSHNEQDLAAFIELASKTTFRHLQMTMDPLGVERVKETH